MKLFIYKDGLCDPGNKIGTAMLVPGKGNDSSRTIEAYLKTLVASMKPTSINKFRAFVVNDDFSDDEAFQEMDNIVLMDEPLTYKGAKYITELNLFEIAMETNNMLQKIDSRRRAILESKNKPRDESIKERVHLAMEANSS